LRKVELALARGIHCDEAEIHVTLTDGRVVSAPLTQRLQAATPRQRRAGYVTDFGTSLRWDEIDEDVGVDYVLGVHEDELLELAGFREGLPKE